MENYFHKFTKSKHNYLVGIIVYLDDTGIYQKMDNKKHITYGTTEV